MIAAERAFWRGVLWLAGFGMGALNGLGRMAHRRLSELEDDPR